MCKPGCNYESTISVYSPGAEEGDIIETQLTLCWCVFDGEAELLTPLSPEALASMKEDRITVDYLAESALEGYFDAIEADRDDAAYHAWRDDGTRYDDRW